MHRQLVVSQPEREVEARLLANRLEPEEVHQEEEGVPRLVAGEVMVPKEVEERIPKKQLGLVSSNREESGVSTYCVTRICCVCCLSLVKLHLLLLKQDFDFGMFLANNFQ